MRRLFFKYILLFIAFLPVSVFAKGKKISKIVVDAGHGGKDFGAHGTFSNEKDVTLACALKLGKILKDSIKNLEVIYTRTTDEYPSLVKRHDIANEAGADLFIAIHANSTMDRITKQIVGYKTIKKKKKTVKQPIYKIVRHHETSMMGVETYVIGLKRLGQQAGEVSDEFSHDSTVSEGVLNENDPQTAIIISQYTSAFFQRSVRLGSKIQEQFAAQKRPDLGVKQKSLEVLAGSAMPGVLVEVGFINNAEEEAYMNSEKGQTEIALAIYRGILAYKNEVEK